MPKPRFTTSISPSITCTVGEVCVLTRRSTRNPGRSLVVMYNANVDRHPIYEENEFISEVGLGLYTMSKYVYASPEFYLL